MNWSVIVIMWTVTYFAMIRTGGGVGGRGGHVRLITKIQCQHKHAFCFQFLQETFTYHSVKFEGSATGVQDFKSFIFWARFQENKWNLNVQNICVTWFLVSGKYKISNTENAVQRFQAASVKLIVKLTLMIYMKKVMVYILQFCNYGNMTV